jgi:hypothetical protein
MQYGLILKLYSRVSLLCGGVRQEYKCHYRSACKYDSWVCNEVAGDKELRLNNVEIERTPLAQVIKFQLNSHNSKALQKTEVSVVMHQDQQLDERRRRTKRIVGLYKKWETGRFGRSGHRPSVRKCRRQQEIQNHWSLCDTRKL